MPKLTAVFDDDTAALLKERAKAEDRSVGAVIRVAVAAHMGRSVGDEVVTRSSEPTTDRKGADSE